MEHISLLQNALETAALPCNADILNRFDTYARLLQQYNKVMNLTAADDDFSIVTRHFIDSIALARAVALPKTSLLDVGCGAGFPSLPCKILYPDMPVCLLDATKKRLDFLREVVSALGLCGVTLLHARAEEAAHDSALRHSFALVTSRAVAKLSVLAELCLPFVQTGGCFAPFKLAQCDTELSEAQRALSRLGGRYQGAFSYTLPQNEVPFSVILIDKIAQTPPAYPRPFAKISKAPL